MITKPGVAARLVHAGIAQLVSALASVEQLQEAVFQGFTDKRFKEASQKMKERVLENSQTLSLDQVLAKLIHVAFVRNVGHPEKDWTPLISTDEWVVDV